jgi:hypothetical protein
LTLYRLLRFASNSVVSSMLDGWNKKRPAFLPSLESDTHQWQFCEDEDDGFREGLNPSYGL